MDAARFTAAGARAGARNDAGAQRAQAQRETGTCSVTELTCWRAPLGTTLVT